MINVRVCIPALHEARWGGDGESGADWSVNLVLVTDL